MAIYRKSKATGSVKLGQVAVGGIALVKLDGIGDFILSTVFLRNLDERLPNANVHIFCRKPVGILIRSQFPRWQVTELPERKKPLFNIFTELGHRRNLGQLNRFDILIDLRAYRDMSDSAVASWIPARFKIALTNCYPEALKWVLMPREDLIFDLLVARPPASAQGVPDEIANYRALAAVFFSDSAETQIDLPTLHAEAGNVANVTSLLANRCNVDASRPFLLVAPASAGKIKQYPAEMLATAIRSILSEMAMPTLLVGSAADAPLISRLAECLHGEKLIIPVAGHFDLVQHVALVSLAAATISMDSATAHIAGALGTPAVVILGGGHYGQFAPWGESKTFRWLTNRLPCFGCHWQCIYDQPLCIHDIPPDEIARNLVEAMKSRCTKHERSPSPTSNASSV